MKKVLVLGISGMLGSTMFRTLSANPHLMVLGSLRSDSGRNYFSTQWRHNIISGVDVTDIDNVIGLFSQTRPDVVINCVGLVKQLDNAQQVMTALPINSVLPHRLANLCALSGARLVHFSTDCVFNGKRGNYDENDSSDAEDVYGRSKFLGEVVNPGAITVRTSIIGHELVTSHSLLNWFLRQKNEVNGYTRSVFSGLPTVEIARIVDQFILPNPSLTGLFHVASNPISKFDLLSLIALQYKKDTKIVPVDHPVLDRSLNSNRFHTATGYVAPSWTELVARMYDDNMDSIQRKEEG